MGITADLVELKRLAGVVTGRRLRWQGDFRFKPQRNKQDSSRRSGNWRRTGKALRNWEGLAYQLFWRGAE